ncbi:MAG TPA: methyl-accepting chemotaxis protein, partial [Gemmatimonadaceae bacterium]
MRLAPLTALVAAAILIPLGMFANREVSQTLRAQADARLETVAKRYAALAQVVASGLPDAMRGLAPDSAVRNTLDGIFATASVSEIDVELADSSGQPPVHSHGATSADIATYANAARAGSDGAFALTTTRGAERGALAPANLGRWVVVAHEPTADADATYHQVRTALAALGVLLFLVLVGVGFAVDRLVNRRIRQPAMELAALAEAVAAGNLTVRVGEVRSTDEIERLGRALATMVAELARLARALSDSARETATMSAEITSSSEQMSSSAAQIAQTASDLSNQSAGMAESIQTLAGSA